MIINRISSISTSGELIAEQLGRLAADELDHQLPCQPDIPMQVVVPSVS